MKLSLLLVELTLISATNCFVFEEDGSGYEESHIEASGSTEPIIGEDQEYRFTDYELADKEDEIILRGRDSLEIIQPEKFIGPQYLLTRPQSDHSEKKEDMISKVVTDINEFISLFSLPSTSTVKFPIDEASAFDDICMCECLKKYEYFHSSEEDKNTDEVKVVLKTGTGQKPCSEHQYKECCQPAVNGSPRFRFPEWNEGVCRAESSRHLVCHHRDPFRLSTISNALIAHW